MFCNLHDGSLGAGTGNCCSGTLFTSLRHSVIACSVLPNKCGCLGLVGEKRNENFYPVKFQSLIRQNLSYPFPFFFFLVASGKL